MTYRDREKQRLVALKRQLFDRRACRPGSYKGRPYPFCLADDRAEHNLHALVRESVLGYFRDRKIQWHDGSPEGAPSGHLCCSQSFCVNVWAPFQHDAAATARLLRALGYDVAEVLPVEGDVPSGTRGIVPPFVGFEWIGRRNYLEERRGPRAAYDYERTRGAHFTAADFVVRFRRSDGRIQMVLGEWKYTETYAQAREAPSGRTHDARRKVYAGALEQDCPIAWRERGVSVDALFHEPFYQMMRLQLLARAIERIGFEADRVTVLHVVPEGNAEVLGARLLPELCPGLDQSRGLHATWASLVPGSVAKPGDATFRGLSAEQVVRAALGAEPPGSREGERPWIWWIDRRYVTLSKSALESAAA